MKKTIKKLALLPIVIVGLLALQFCQNGGPPPEPCPPPGEAPEGCVWDEADCQWVCEPDPDPDPAPDPDPSAANPADYIVASQVENLVHWQTHAWEGLYAYSNNLTWAGNRDILSVLRNCPWAFGDEDRDVFGLTQDEARWMADTGEALGRENDGFLRRLWEETEPDNDRSQDGVPILNRRCAEQPEFCDRTNIRKDVWNEFKDRMLEFNQRANGLRGTAGQCRHDDMDAYDSISGWCQMMNRAGHQSCP